MDKKIYIESIECSGCGPIEKLSLTPAPLTLIYGENEAGKTTLVENLLSVLFFRSRSEEKKLRESLKGTMKVSVRGLEDTGILFKGSHRGKRLEDYLPGDDKNFSHDLLPLLYVRASETALGESPGGVEGRDLQGLVSEQRLIESLYKKLSGETGYIYMEGGRLGTEKKIGPWKNLEEMKQRINRLAATAEEFASALSERGVQALEEKIKGLEKEKRDLEHGRRHRAFELAAVIKKISADPLVEGKKYITELEILAGEYAVKIKELASRRERLKKIKWNEGDLQWLKAAEAAWIAGTSPGTALGQKILLALGGLCAVALPVVYSFFKPMVVPVIAVTSLVVFMVILFTVFSPPGSGTSAEELRAIALECEERFGAPLKSVADFSRWRGEVEGELSEAKVVRPMAESLEGEVRLLEEKTAGLLALLGHPGAGAAGAASALGQRLDELERKKLAAREQLAALDVPPGDYEETPSKVRYSPGALKKNDAARGDLREALEKENRHLQELRQRLGEFVGSETAFSHDTAALMEALYREEESLRAETREILGTMIGGLAVKEVLDDLQSREMQFLAETLNEANLTGLLQKITGRYNSFHLDEGRLLVGDGREYFSIDDLSSGAREQVLMVLRAGMAMKTTGQDRLFMILDDAFQFSDWKRRQRLVEMVVSMVMEGWQIIYLTMDDDLRDRFAAAAPSLGEKNFKLVNLVSS